MDIDSPRNSPIQVKNTSDMKTAIDNLAQQRNDKRSHNAVRPLFLKVNLIGQARGSSYIEMGRTKILCAVYGPREVAPKDSFSIKGQLCCEFKFATFSGCYSNQQQMMQTEKSYSELISEALSSAVRLEKFPKATLDIFITVLEHDGSCLAAAITCASLAIVDAGIEMYDLVIGTSILRVGHMTLVDPMESEETLLTRTCKYSELPINAGVITVGYMPAMQQVCLLLHQGLLDVNSAAEGVKMCTDAALQLFPVVQQCLMKVVKMQTRLSGS